MTHTDGSRRERAVSQVVLPFAFDGQHAFVQPGLTHHAALLEQLSGTSGADGDRPESESLDSIDRIARWVRAVRPWLGTVTIAEGEVASFWLSERVTDFFEYEPDEERDPDVLASCDRALRVALAICS